MFIAAVIANIMSADLIFYVTGPFSLRNRSYNKINRLYAGVSTILQIESQNDRFPQSNRKRQYQKCSVRKRHGEYCITST